MSASSVGTLPAQRGRSLKSTLPRAEIAASESSLVAPLHYQPLVVVLLAVCAGIVADHLVWLGSSTSFFIPHLFLLWWLVAAGALTAWFVLWKRHRTIWANTALIVT